MLLANGAAVPISQLKVGEKVLATDTRTGKTQPETVAAVLVHHDSDLYDLKIKASGRTSVIDTTRNHLFWNPGTGGQGGRWVKAGVLRYGDHLRTSGGGYATVTGGWTPEDTYGWMWDLTIPGNSDHDFYIAAGDATVLVHNDNGDKCKTAQDAANDALEGGQTRGAASRLTLPDGGDSITDVSGSPRSINPDMQSALDSVPEDVRAPWHGYCSEIGCMNEALKQGRSLAGGEMETVAIGDSAPGHLEPKPACGSCSWVMDIFGVAEDG